MTGLRRSEKSSAEAIFLALDWLSVPVKWDRHLRRASASMDLSVVYGHLTLASEHSQILDVRINDFAKRIRTAARLGPY
jgi:hypothetical protein